MFYVSRAHAGNSEETAAAHASSAEPPVLCTQEGRCVLYRIRIAYQVLLAHRPALPLLLIGLGIYWLAATVGSSSAFKKLSKKEIMDCNIPRAVDKLIHPEEPLVSHPSVSPLIPNPLSNYARFTYRFERRFRGGVCKAKNLWR